MAGKSMEMRKHAGRFNAAHVAMSGTRGMRAPLLGGLHQANQQAIVLSVVVTGGLSLWRRTRAKLVFNTHLLSTK